MPVVHPYVLCICFLELLSEMLKTAIVVKPSESETSSHNSDSLPWSEQKDLSLEKQLLAKWHQDRMYFDIASSAEEF